MGDELSRPAPPAGSEPDDAAERPLTSDLTTQELRAIQARRAGDETKRAEEADEAGDRRAAERRAERADYLRAKLEEQAEADEDA